MAKQYKVRKKCLICKNVFFPSYAGSFYCNACKNKKTPVASPVKKTAKKTVKKAMKPAKKVSAKKIKKPIRKAKR